MTTSRSQMYSVTALVLAGLALVDAITNPIKVTSSQWIANYEASPSDPYILRDGGAVGQIGGVTVLTYSDTSSCPNQTAFQTGKGCTFLHGNSIVKASYVASEVFDYSSPRPSVFCGQQGTGVSGNGRLHLGNLIPTGATTGAIWYVQESQDGVNGCTELDGCPVALGVAAVNGPNALGEQPTCSPQATFWDPKEEPTWGSNAAVAGNDGYFYLWGQIDGGVPGGQYGDVYMARVANGSQLNYNAYQYWNGSHYTSTRLRNPNYNGYSPSSVLQNVHALGSAYYSPYYKSYVTLAVNKTAGNGHTVLAWTATRPEGPWSTPISLYSNTSIGDSTYAPIYAPIGLTNFDTSGKTLTLAWSQFGRNTNNGVVKLTFA